MTILVIGGTGKVGAHLVEQLAAAGAKLRVLTRSAERAALLPPAAEPAVARIVADPAAALPAFRGVEQVFMLNQPTPEETAEGMLAVALARAAGVRRFVYQAVFRPEQLAHLPHIGSKRAIARAVTGAGMEWTLLCPNHFFQNDALTRRALLEDGRYHLPIGPIGCSGIDARDIADAAAHVLGSDGHARQSYPLVGAEAIAGPDAAAQWGAALGRPVRYDGDLGTWEAAVRAFMPAWLAFDLALMYRSFADGFLADAGEVAETARLLGRPQRRYADFVRETAMAWTSP